MKKKIRIIVDAMGGDFAPHNEVEGGLLALQASKSNDINLDIIYIGDSSKIEPIVSSSSLYDEFSEHITIVAAKEIVAMHDDPIQALKTKKESSMVKGIQLLKDGGADGYISAGNTGATLTIATMILGRIEGVSRPTIGAFLPTSQKKPVLLLDVGATIDCHSRYLFEYAIMGSIYSKAIQGIDKPSIGLLNVGEEDTKGGAERVDAYKQLQESSMNFFGNVEGGDVLLGKTDVVVTDGFSGNCILKFAEGFPKMFAELIPQYVCKSSDRGTDMNVVVPVLKDMLSGLNAEEYGGVPLLGVKGTVIIGHGNSTPRTIMMMIFSAVTAIEKEVDKKIEAELKKK
ncbi:MAG: phosphate acyltransferase PlsX [Ignavibacteria bacterium]|jgi:glycerol-3-phosphate acyltransferase PlsX|nr:phosphate acyltransferase PlsX [Ignavibacteria bacterium]